MAPFPGRSSERSRTLPPSHPGAEAHQEITHPLCGPGSGRMSRHAQDVQRPGWTLITNSTYTRRSIPGVGIVVCLL